jgi:hypothetical protein
LRFNTARAPAAADKRQASGRQGNRLQGNGRNKAAKATGEQGDRRNKPPEQDQPEQDQ